MALSVLLVTCLILKLLETGVTATNYCVIEQTSTDSNCQTLQYYAKHLQNISNQDGNITMTFLPGDHKLTEITFHLINRTSVAFTTWAQQNVKISVGFGAGITLENITNLTIQHVTIIPNPIEGALIFKNIQLFRLIQMNITYTQVKIPPPTISPSMSNIRNTEITQSTFDHCILIFGQEHDSSIKEISLALQNVSISSVRFHSIHSAVRITMDEGTYLLNFTNSSISSQNTGIHLKVYNSKLIFDMENVNITNSHDGLYIEDMSDKQLSTVTVNAAYCLFEANRYGIVVNSLTDVPSTVIVTMKNCNITNNTESGIIIHKSRSVKLQMTVEFCHFTGNTGVSILIDATDDEEGSKLKLNNCTFLSNEDVLQARSVVQLHGYIETRLSNCFFQDNQNTPIEINFGDLVFTHNNWFIGNRGYYGGGVSLIDSTVIFTVNAQVYFTNNSARFGGAIYVVKTSCASKSPLCFYSAANSSYIYLTENTADSGGDEIYGAALNDTCIANSNSNTSVSVYRNHFKFNNYTEPKLSLVTSDPKRICLCRQDTLIPICSDINYIFNTSIKNGYPGEYFVFYIALVGYEFGTVSGTAYIRALDTENVQSVAINSTSCTAVNYTINSKLNTTVTLVLTTQEIALREYGDRDYMEAAIETYNESEVIPESLLTTPVYIDIKVQDCPEGFSFNDRRNICECDLKNQTTCIICNSQRLFKMSGTQWIGEEKEGVLYTEHAPHGHINTSEKWVTLDGVANECPAINGESLEVDEQCANNHTGQLCGNCSGNYSLTLGRPDCKECAYKGLAFIVFFILAGPLLVAFHFFDAYTGILEDKYHYWVGVLILARGAILITTAITQDKRHDLIALAIISALLCLHTGVYKKWYLTLIEKSFLLNLNLFATALLGIYVQQGVDGSKQLGNTVTGIFVGISFAQFVCIIIGHIFMQGRKLYQKYYTQPEEDPNNPPLLIEGRDDSQFAN